MKHKINFRLYGYTAAVCLMLLGGVAHAKVVVGMGIHDISAKDKDWQKEARLSQAEAAGRQGDYLTLLTALQDLSQSGYAPAQERLAELYRNGLPPQPEQSKKWQQKAIEAYYRQGESQELAKNFPKAVKSYLRAAKMGHTAAQSRLGLWYAEGRGQLAKDTAQARYWAEQAAAKNDAQAQNILGLMYENGDGVRQDYARALSLYRQSALQGHRGGSYNLAMMYKNGHGVPRDLYEAARWMLVAVEAGNPVAADNLRQILKEIKQTDKAAAVPSAKPL